MHADVQDWKLLGVRVSLSGDSDIIIQLEGQAFVLITHFLCYKDCGLNENSMVTKHKLLPSVCWNACIAHHAISCAEILCGVEFTERQYRMYFRIQPTVCPGCTALLIDK